MPRLSRSFYRRSPDVVAQELLGQRLVRVLDGERLAGFIVETEAYLGTIDKAAHSFGNRRTARTETMYADGGTLYVFLNYGIHHLLNVVTETKGVPTAVLIRAIEPTEGLEVMRRYRAKSQNDTGLCSGPGKLGQALGVDRSFDQTDLVTSPTLFIERSKQRNDYVAAKRIGIDYAAEWAEKQLRFYLPDNAHVSVRR